MARVAIVTGGTRGIGEAISVALRDQGMKVAANYAGNEERAREFTERWVHQQQIRDAVGKPGLTERRWLHPVLDAFARALPHALRDHAAPGGTRE